MIFIETRENLIPAIAPELVETAARAALAHQQAPAEADLTIVLTDDSQLQELNLEWMGIDAPTDVLSFPSEEIDPETGFRYLGDILISTPRAALQAAALGHRPEEETQLLVIHGILHLLGHDHAEPEEKARMWAAQREILQSLGLANLKIQE
ncbi:MAG: rRNA maturation RNase YbeY [Anaerolineales bacterium]